MFKNNVMYERLKALYAYTEYCTVEELDSLDRITLDYAHILNPDTNIYENGTDKITKRFYFNSGLGMVKIELNKDFTLGGDIYYSIDYSNYAGSDVFKVSAMKKTLEVEPLLGEMLMAEDIDLAIYELESYLKVELGTSEDIKQEKINEEKRKRKLHEEQLKILKGK